MLELLGFLLTSLITGLYIIYKLKHDGLPGVLRRRLNKSVVREWQKKLPQRLPKYNYPAPKNINESGVIAQDLEYTLERPSPTPGDADQVCFYGSDSEGNVVLAKISKMWGGWASAQLSIKVNQTLYTVQSEGISTNNFEFALGNFKLEMVEPFRVWRIWYNGMMKTERSGELAHGVINFLWKPLDHPFDCMKDASQDLLSEELIRSEYNHSPELTSMLTTGYSQFGSLHGTIKISCAVDDTNLTQLNLVETVYLHGFRHKRLLPLQKQSDNTNHHASRLELFGFCESNGVAFRLQGYNGSWVDGQIFYPGKDMTPVCSVDSLAQEFQNDLTLPKLFTICDSKASLRVEIWPKLEKLTGEPIKATLLRLNISGKAGHGILLRGLDECLGPLDLLENPEFLKRQINSVNESSRQSSAKEDLIDFYSEGCTQVSLVGGKGASLARLAHLEKQTSSQFKTAKGFCVTTNMFRKMIDLSELTKAFDASFCADDPSLEKSCSAAMEIIKSSHALDELRKILPPFLSSTFGQSHSSIRYAVRSSGVLEDGAELSCAGQNETFLGVEEQSIPDKVIQCWCSLFTPQSVNYRLNHGQPAVSEIAVVIQEMVDASSAGVMFTADPRTGNPFEMLLTANFGLGESVVSAACDPDTFILHRIPTSGNSQFSSNDLCRIKIASRTLGEKKSKIIMTGSATKEAQLSEYDSKTFSTEDFILLKLGEIGVQLETQLGNMKPVDIEWAVTKNGDIYVLQSRAMTSLDVWTDFEITHEFDTALRSNVERMTRANTGEVTPDAIYPIGIQASLRLIDIGVQDTQLLIRGRSVCPFTPKSSPIFGQRMFLDMLDCLYSKIEANPHAPATACIDLAVFGRPVITKEIHDIAKERYGLMTKLDSIKGLKTTYDVVSRSKPLIERAEKTYKDIQLDYSLVEQTSKDVYAQITKDLEILLDIMTIHCTMSHSSSSTLVFAFLFLTEQKEVKDWSPSLYEDAGTILSAYSAVESAEIPVDINRLGTTIVEHGVQPEQFLTFSTTHEAMGWLRSNSIIDKALREFLQKHGHRSVAELDMGQTPWKKDPAPLVTLLKNIVRGQLELRNNPQASHSASRPTFHSEDELLASLKTPLKSTSKKLLKFILPYCRRSVAFREKSKSLAVRILSLIKEGYALLGDLMAQEQIIPDSDLIIFLTHYEMGMLIKRDPATTTILYKAMRRSKLYSVLNNTDYPELSIGFPKPIDKFEKVEIVDVIRGTPVSSGTVKGIAKVCRSVEEASELIYPGDILITKGTDVAWSPFFPIIGGVVTELGGLISHGAVVAREYGLPCIVGAVNATKIFQSGDEVILDTSTGTLSKVKTVDQKPQY